MSRAPGQDILLDTSAGSPVPNEHNTIISQPLAAAAWESKVAAPSIMRSRTDPRFNCHGLTFGSRRTAIYDDADVIRIIREDGYKAITTLADVLPGDVALYFADDGSIDHSAVVVSMAGNLGVPFVVSKWGPNGPEVYHLATSCFEYSINDIRYYRVER